MSIGTVVSSFLVLMHSIMIHQRRGETNVLLTAYFRHQSHNNMLCFFQVRKNFLDATFPEQVATSYSTWSIYSKAKIHQVLPVCLFLNYWWCENVWWTVKSMFRNSVKQGIFILVYDFYIRLVNLHYILKCIMFNETQTHHFQSH